MYINLNPDTKILLSYLIAVGLIVPNLVKVFLYIRAEIKRLMGDIKND